MTGEAIFFALGCGITTVGCLLAFWLGREHAYSDARSIYARALRESEAARNNSIAKTLRRYCG